MQAGADFNHSLQHVLNKHGAHVPNYNVFGQQHNRVPHKDKVAAAAGSKHPLWSGAPTHGTRTELLEARKAERRPDPSYDIDGDGAVGPADYFISRQLCKPDSNRLDTSDRERVVKELESGWLDKFSFGHDAAGVKRTFPVVQQRGKIISVDNMHELGEMFPPHPMSSVEPNFKTAQDMLLFRKGDLRNHGNVLKDSWDAQNPAHVPEPQPVRGGPGPDGPGRTRTHRQEALRQNARETAGLHPVNTAVNAVREEQNLGMTYREKPEFATRTELRETRRTRLCEELENTREMGESHHVPNILSNTIRDQEEYEMRRPNLDAMTLTQLKQSRKRDFIEHNQSNFSRGQPESVSFSKQPEPWWTMRDGYVQEPEPCMLKAVRDPTQEVAMKVTQVEHPRRRPQAGPDPQGSEQAQSSARGVPRVHDLVGEKTLKSWKAEMLSCGGNEDRNQQRLFDGVVDGVKQAAAFSRDSEPLHAFSSFESIKETARGQELLQQKRAAREDHEKAHTWRQFAQTGATRVEDEYDARPVQAVWARGLSAGSRTSSKPPQATVDQPAPLAPVPARQQQQRPQQRLLAPTLRVPAGVPAAEASGEDPPMTERLHRMAASRAIGAAGGPLGGGGSGGAGGGGGTGRAGTETPLSARGQRQVGRASSSAAGSVALSPRGAAAPTRPATLGPQPPMVVRVGGFQWLDRQFPVRRIDEGRGSDSRTLSRQASLGPTPQGSRSRLGSEQLPRSSLKAY